MSIIMVAPPSRFERDRFEYEGIDNLRQSKLPFTFALEDRPIDSAARQPATTTAGTWQNAERSQVLLAEGQVGIRLQIGSASIAATGKPVRSLPLKNLKLV